MGGLPSTKKGKLPSSLPKTVTKPKGLPSTSKPQYAIPEGQIDELIAANEELIAEKQSIMKDSNPFKTKYIKLAELSGKTHHEITQLMQDQIEELSGLIDQTGAFIIVCKNLGFDSKIIEQSLQVQHGAIDFDAFCDDHAELECLVPPDPKPTNPLEAAVDKDVAREKIPPVEITLLMLDTADDIYYDLVDEQALIPDDRNGKKPSSYWDLGKKIEKQKQHMISIGRRWRAQQDALMREVLERHTKALLGGK